MLSPNWPLDHRYAWVILVSIYYWMLLHAWNQFILPSETFADHLTTGFFIDKWPSLRIALSGPSWVQVYSLICSMRKHRNYPLWTPVMHEWLPLNRHTSPIRTKYRSFKHPAVVSGYLITRYAWMISPLNRYVNPIRTTNRLLRAV